MPLTAMKPLNVRFSKETKVKIKEVASSNQVAESLTARAAINIGLGMIEVARESMTNHEFIMYLDKCQREF